MAAPERMLWHPSSDAGKPRRSVPNRLADRRMKPTMASDPRKTVRPGFSPTGSSRQKFTGDLVHPAGSIRMVWTIPAQARTGQRRESEVRYIVTTWFFLSVFCDTKVILTAEQQDKFGDECGIRRPLLKNRIFSTRSRFVFRIPLTDRYSHERRAKKKAPMARRARDRSDGPRAHSHIFRSRPHVMAF